MTATVPESSDLRPAVQHLLGSELAASVATALDGYSPRQTEVGLPVLLGPNGWPWDSANRWLRERFAAKAGTSAPTYAANVVAWARWCWAAGVDPAEPMFEDLLDYRDDMLDEGIAGSSWNRYLASITSWLRWLDEEDGGQRVPTGLTNLRVQHGGNVVTAVSLDDYRLFRDVGLRGLSLDGLMDPGFPGITGERDGVFADLLVSTGMRRGEAAHLLLLDVSLAAEGRSPTQLYLPGPICKRGKPRHIDMPAGFMRVYRQFLGSEWPNIVAHSQRHLRRRSDLLLVDDLRDGEVRVAGRWRRVDGLGPTVRRRLVTTAAVAEMLGLHAEPGWHVPLTMFPATRGVAQTPGSWSNSFRTARQRTDAILQSEGLEPLPRITPHVLRHTYGVEYLKSALELLQEHSWDQMSQDERKFKKYLMSPLTDLRERMGHVRIETTMDYLTALKSLDPVKHTPWVTWSDALFDSTGDGDEGA